jgi:hypothetical protein
MKKDVLMEFGISDEIADKIVKVVNNEFSDFVPKSRFNSVIEQRDKYKTDYDNSVKQLEELTKSAKNFDNLKVELEKSLETNKQLISDHEKAIAKINLDNAVEMSLVKANAKNTKAVKALMSDFLESATLDGDNVKGLDDVITKLKETDGYLFNSSNEGFKGSSPKDNGGAGQPSSQSVFEARLAEARTNGNQVEQIKIKQEASALGISLM